VVGGEFFGGGEADDASFGVGFFGFFKDDEVADQVEDCRFVQHALDQGFELVVGGFEGGGFGDRVFEFDDDEGDAVDEQDQVGAFGLVPMIVMADDGELVGDDEFVVFRVVEVDRPD
jgi:hypothetical protein